MPEIRFAGQMCEKHECKKRLIWNIFLGVMGWICDRCIEERMATMGAIFK